MNDSVHRERMRIAWDCNNDKVLTQCLLWLSDLACGLQLDGLPRVYFTALYIFSNFNVIWLSTYKETHRRLLLNGLEPKYPAIPNEC
jgi:hypothetical protein